MAAFLGIGSILLLKLNSNAINDKLKIKDNQNPIGDLKVSIINRVNPKEAYKNIKNKTYKIIVDTRNSKEWNNFHILGSLNTKNLNTIYSTFTKKLNLPLDISGMEFIGENNKAFMLVVVDTLEQAEEFSKNLKEINVLKVDYLINGMEQWKKELPYVGKSKSLSKSNMRKLANDTMFDIIVDIRDKQEFEKKSFKNAINLVSLGTNPDKIRKLRKISKTSHILVFGDAKNKVERAVDVLDEYGYKNLYKTF